jgi:anti-sigma factor RsiW
VTCRELSDFIGDYFAGELPAEISANFERHLAVCPNCRRYLASYEETVKLGKRAFDNDGADVPEALVQAILASRPQAS